MIKKFFVGILICLIMSGCGNEQLIDLNYTFNYAIIKMADGTVVEGKVDSWKDYEDGDQMQIKMDGKTYLVHASNLTLINK